MFFSWYIQMEDASFVYIDEFDAFYHYQLSDYIVNKLKSFSNSQIIIAVHDTNLMSNELLRPDCYYILNDNKITSLPLLRIRNFEKAITYKRCIKQEHFMIKVSHEGFSFG